MIDIHTHILPGIDDGSPDLDTSIRMARIAYEEGITQMIATPHFISMEKEDCKDLIVEKVKELNDAIMQNGINLKVYPGEEIFLTPDIPDRYVHGDVFTLADTGRYLLIELPMMSFPEYVFDVIYRLNVMGVRTIIAHPERNRIINQNIDRAGDLIEAGALMQINSLSLFGVFGRESKNTAQKLYKKGMINFIATDCHTAGGRSPRMARLYDIINKKDLFKYTETNPSYIFAGKNLPLEEKAPEEGKNKTSIIKNLFSLFKGEKEAKDET
jgi:hypothetical protein